MTKKRVTADRIDSAPMETGGSSTVPTGNDPFTEDPILAQKMGLIGKLIGDNEHNRTSVAVIAMVVGFLVVGLGVGMLFAGDSHPATERADIVITGGLSVISAAVGFVFGQNSKPDV